MPKRISETQRLISFAMNASEEGLSNTIETLRAIQSNRFPKSPSKPATPRTRGPKKAKREAEQLVIPGTPLAASEDESEAEDARPAHARKVDKFQPDPAMLRNIEESKQAAGAN
jgi:hypothetical protein